MEKSKIVLFIEGLLLIILGLLVISRPAGSILALSMFFTWFLIILGIVELVGVFVHKDKEHRKFHMIDGIVLLVLGFLFLVKSPLLSAAVLIYMTIFWFILSSVALIGLASKSLNGLTKYLIYVMNVIVIAISIYALFNPAVATGIFIITLSFNFFLNGVSRLLLIFVPKNDNLIE